MQFAIDEKKSSVVESERECRNIEHEILNLNEDKRGIEINVVQMRSAIDEKKRSVVELEKECRNIEHEILNLNEDKKGIETDVVRMQSAIDEKKQAITAFENECKQKNDKIDADILGMMKTAELTSKNIANVNDGRIIGDGRSDFTRDVTPYDFERFAVLDLPGIEGNEGLVLDNINAAVQKAHAVFYVTSTSRAPQTGDSVQGTLEKIKAHLGQQTEVYTIFNKRIKNPQALKEGLINDDEQESLKVLDKTMREHLGEQYQESISVSAYPAFLSVAHCWENDYDVQKKKFLEHFSEQNLLEMTLLPQFHSRLTEKMVNDSQAKIKRSNFKKVRMAINNTKTEIEAIHQNMRDFEQKLIETKAGTDKQLDASLSELKRQLELQGSDVVGKFKINVRKAVYDKIEGDLSNSDFKAVLESSTKDGIQKLQENLSTNFQKKIEDFQENVADIIKKFEKYAIELLNVCNSTKRLDTNFELKINLKSGVNWSKLLISVATGVIGVIFALSNPWVVIALSIGVLVSTGKAVASLCNKKFKKSEQRKSTDKSLDGVTRKLSESIQDNFKEPFRQLDKGVKSIKDELQKSIFHVKELNRILMSVQAEFAALATEIEKEGEK
jgi:hypothetical protein